MITSYFGQVSNAINHGRVLVNTVPILILSSAAEFRRSVLIQNLSVNDVYVGGSSVSILNGMKLIPGASIEIYTVAAVYAIASLDGSDVRYLEEA